MQASCTIESRYRAALESKSQATPPSSEPPFVVARSHGKATENVVSATTSCAGWYEIATSSFLEDT